MARKWSCSWGPTKGSRCTAPRISTPATVRGEESPVVEASTQNSENSEYKELRASSHTCHFQHDPGWCAGGNDTNLGLRCGSYLCHHPADLDHLLRTPPPSDCQNPYLSVPSFLRRVLAPQHTLPGLRESVEGKGRRCFITCHHCDISFLFF